MNDILKQRLVGALVLIALGVVFWPVLFVEGERGSLDRQSQIEPMPALDDVTIPAPRPLPGVEPVRQAPEPSDAELAAAAEPPAEASEAASTDDNGGEPQGADRPATDVAAVPDISGKASAKVSRQQAAAVPALPEKEAPAPAPESPALDEQGIPIAWVLQVASVSTREKADKLTADLIAQDYKAYHRAVRRDDVVLYRVFIGPVFERDKLTAVKREVDRQLKVSAIIARYVP